MSVKPKHRFFAGAALVGALAAISGPAYAVNDAMMDLLKILKDKGSITQQEYELLTNAAKADAEQVEGNVGEVKAVAATLPKVETKDKIVIGSQDGDFKWQPIGRVMGDYIWTDEDKTELESGGELRRARLGMEAVVWKHWEGKLEVDFGEDEVSVKDAYVGYTDGWSGGKWWIKAGQQHVPFGFSTLSSSKYMTFMNRPIYADNEIQPARQVGVAAFINGARWTGHVGVFTGNLDEPEDCVFGAENDGEGECDQEFAFGARVTGVPFMQDPAHLLQIGAGILYKNPNGSTIDVDQRDAIIHIIDSKNLNADFKGTADDAFAFNAEAVGVWGPAHFKGEYANMDVSRNVGTLKDVTLDAWSFDLGFFLTGESKNLDVAKAQYGGVKPKGIVGKGGIGAWEIGLRYEEADYNDSDAGFIGGEMELLTVGLNWYVNNTMRFMANYVTTLDYDEPGSSDDNDEPSAFMVRSQIYW
jgi:phosphate-selective porin OprO/OprP